MSVIYNPHSAIQHIAIVRKNIKNVHPLHLVIVRVDVGVVVVHEHAVGVDRGVVSWISLVSERRVREVRN
jgi:hypothetical protein